MFIGCLHDFVDVICFDSVVGGPIDKVISVDIPGIGVIDVGDASEYVFRIDFSVKDDVIVFPDVHDDVAGVVFDNLIGNAVVHVFGFSRCLLCCCAGVLPPVNKVNLLQWL